MSYTIAIVAGEPPTTYEHALDIRDDCLDAEHLEPEPGDAPLPERPSADMRELHRRLTARFPCICDDSDGPWSDGPLINNFGYDATVLGISFSRAAEVVPFIVETATSMGFWVVDTQDEVVYLSGGGVLRAEEPNAEPPVEKRWWHFWR